MTKFSDRGLSVPLIMALPMAKNVLHHTINRGFSDERTNIYAGFSTHSWDYVLFLPPAEGNFDRYLSEVIVSSPQNHFHSHPQR
jgi:hypothetical protein